MSDYKVDRADWGAVCHRLSEAIVETEAEIDVASSAIGEQVEVKRARFLGVTYDPKDELVEMALEGVDHFVRNPSEMIIQGTPARIKALVVIAGEGEGHRLRFHSPLSLDPPLRNLRT